MSNTTSCPHKNLNVLQVTTLFEEVQNRYINKLKSIDEKQIINEERHKQKLIIYESYVKDLSIQIRLLLQSLEELEKEANQRVALLETKLRRTQASLQHHHSLSDISKNVETFETDKWSKTHENLDLKHDVDALTSFINIAKRTGKWDTKRLQLKTVPIDRVIGGTRDEPSNSIPLHKEIQYRDERIQVLQAEIEHLRKIQIDKTKQSSTLHSEDELKEQNLILTKKVDDLRLKLAEECQKTETFKMDLRLKLNQIKDLQHELTEKKQQYEEHIHDLSSKLKTISERHRESTEIINNDVQLKKQNIEQLTKQVEQIINEKVSVEKERNDLQRECRLKDSMVADLEAQVRNLQLELAIQSQSLIHVESTVSKVEYEKLDFETSSLKKRLDATLIELKGKDMINNKLEQDLRLLKKIHEDQLTEHFEKTASDIDRLNSEIQTLKRFCDDKTAELQKQTIELRSCQEHLSVEYNKSHMYESEQQKLKNLLEISNEQLENVRSDLKQSKLRNDEYEAAINDLHSRYNVLEGQLIETMSLADSHNKTLIEYQQQTEKYKNELVQKQKEYLDQKSHIDQLEQSLIKKTAEVAQLTETLEADLLKNQHRERFAEENATKALNEIQVLQNEIRHLSESLIERERTNGSLNERLHQLTNELRTKQDESQQIQKSLNKQLQTKQEQLVRYDQNLHDAEIQLKYAKEECLIQEKEIMRLNSVQEEKENKMRILQQNLVKLQEQLDALNIQCERSETDLRNVKIYREDENRKYNHEFEKLSNEIAALRASESTLLKTIDELKEKILNVSNEHDIVREQNEVYQNELDNLQKLLYEETEMSSRSSSKVILLTRQLDDEQKRANDAINQLNDLQMQFKSVLMSKDTLKIELSQARLLIQDHVTKDADFKHNINEMSALLDERTKCLDERQQEIETLNQVLSHVQVDFERSQNDLSLSRDQIVQMGVDNQTWKQQLTDKTNELNILINRFQQVQQELHSYEKDHRYSNEEYFEREQRLKILENELTAIANNHEKLQQEYHILNEELEKYRYDYEQVFQSDMEHKERLMQAMDESKIYKEKLALIGECFASIIRKASETSERWSNITEQLYEQINNLTEDNEKLHSLDEQFEQSTKILAHLRLQHEDLVVQYLSLKPIVDKANLIVHDYKRKWIRVNDENRHLHKEIKRLRDKIDDFHRNENLMNRKFDEQDFNLENLRKELNKEHQARTEAQSTIEQLKHRLNETTCECEKLMKNMSIANKKIEQSDRDISEFSNENHLLQQKIERCESQLAILSSQNETLERKIEQNERSHQDKISECESLIISLKEANKNSLISLEEKQVELNRIKNELESCTYEQSTAIEKIEKLEEINQEFRRHIALLERSIEEHKRLVRKRDKELEQMKNEFEYKALNTSSLNNKCTKQDAEISILRMENTSLKEELRLMQDNVNHCQDEQRRLRKDCDQALNYIHDGIPDMCLNNKQNRILQTYVLQDMNNKRDFFHFKNFPWFPLISNLNEQLINEQNPKKNQQLMKIYSKQQKFILDQLENHVEFDESGFHKKRLPAIGYSTIDDSMNSFDNNYQWKNQL